MIAAVRPATTTFASLRVRNFRLYVAGQTVSVAGNWMQNVAVGWLVLSLSGDGGLLGLVIACRYAPILLLASWGGLIADRHDPRTLLRITACCQTVISATIGVLTLTGWIGIASLAALILAAGVVDVCEVPSRQTILHRLVGPDLVGNAVALNSIAINVARVLGPGVAGLLVVWVGTGWCFVANAATYLAVFAGLQALRVGQLHALGAGGGRARADPGRAALRARAPGPAGAAAAGGHRRCLRVGVPGDRAAADVGHVRR